MRMGWLVGMIVAIIAWGGPAWADGGPGSGFAGSPHDFSGEHGGTDQRSGRDVRTGPCTFCHTPHKAQGTRLLWNHTYSQNTYSWTEITQTTGGTPLPTIRQDWTGPTKFCLSCHDGTVAIGDIAWFNRQSWQGARAIKNDKHDSGSLNIASTTGNMRRNHPVAHPYPFLGAGSTYNQTTTGNRVQTQNFNPDPTARGIRLFSDATGIVVAKPEPGRAGIECTSCHGVHNEKGIVQDDKLLRGMRDSDKPDYICTKCHRNLMQGEPHRQ